MCDLVKYQVAPQFHLKINGAMWNYLMLESETNLVWTGSKVNKVNETILLPKTAKRTNKGLKRSAESIHQARWCISRKDRSQKWKVTHTITTIIYIHDKPKPREICSLTPRIGNLAPQNTNLLSESVVPLTYSGMSSWLLRNYTSTQTLLIQAGGDSRVESLSM